MTIIHFIAILFATLPWFFILALALSKDVIFGAMLAFISREKSLVVLLSLYGIIVKRLSNDKVVIISYKDENNNSISFFIRCNETLTAKQAVAFSEFKLEKCFAALETSRIESFYLKHKKGNFPIDFIKYAKLAIIAYKENEDYGIVVF